MNNSKYIELCTDDKEKEQYLTIVGRLKEKYENAKAKGVLTPKLYAVQNWVISVQSFLLRCATYGFTSKYEEIMKGTLKQEILEVSYGNALMKALGEITVKYVFQSRHIQKLEISAGTIIDFLLKKFVKAAIRYDTEIEQNALDKRLMNIISQNYMNTYRVYSKEKGEEEKLYLRLLLVTDYICGMTDTYAKTLYQELCGIV